MKISASFIILVFLVLISSCSEQQPEDIIREYENLVSSGNCEPARALTTGQAAEHLQATIDAGCYSFEREVREVNCEINADTAVCKCHYDQVYKEGPEDLYWKYELQRIDGDWKIIWIASDWNK